MADIVQISELRLERKRRGFCRHTRLTYDYENKLVECLDCGLPVDTFQAFMIVVENYNTACADLKRRSDELKELENRCGKNLLLATKKVDEAWRRKNMLPCCPHCNEAIAPEDGFGGHMVNKAMEMERRKFKREEP